MKKSTGACLGDSRPAGASLVHLAMIITGGFENRLGSFVRFDSLRYSTNCDVLDSAGRMQLAPALSRIPDKVLNGSFHFQPCGLVLGVTQTLRGSFRFQPFVLVEGAIQTQPFGLVEGVTQTQPFGLVEGVPQTFRGSFRFRPFGLVEGVIQTQPFRLVEGVPQTFRGSFRFF